MEKLNEMEVNANANANAEVFNAEKAEELVKGLRERFKEGKTKSYEWRMSQLEGILKMINEKEKEITDALRDDVGKPEMEAYLHEIFMSTSSVQFALKQLKNWMKPQKVPVEITTLPSTAKIVTEPLGVVLVISAWNYPFLLSIDPVIGAIAAGNCVVLKPSEISPVTSALFAKILPEYIDSSCIKVVEGAVAETTALLDQQWDKIFYTGNGRVARIVMSAAAKHLTPVSLELGGKSPVVVDSNVNLKVAVKRIVLGKWGGNNGQTCIAPDYIITTKSFAPKLVDTFKTTIEKFFGKDPIESDDISRIVNLNHFKRLTDLLDDEMVSNKIVYGGKRDEKRLRIAPTLILNAPHDSQIMKDEIFGPLLPIITVEKLEDSYDIITSRTKPLAAYIFTKNKKLEEEFIRNISAGGILVNDITLHLANPHLPFGGVGESGIGAYHGKFSFDAFSHKKAVLSRWFLGEARARYPPYTENNQRLLRRVLNGSLVALCLAVLGFPWN